MIEMTPKSEGFSMPPEWHPHAGCYMAMPYREEEWDCGLDAAHEEIKAFSSAIDASEKVLWLDRDTHDYGDSWVRDTAPVFVTNGDEVAAVVFKFNGWGGSYLMGNDDQVAMKVAKEKGVRIFECPLILEGGALEVDGEGTLLTTRDCVLNENRGAISEEEATRLLCEYVGVDKVIWLDACLAGDHTDGHIDTLARFIKPGEVLCMRAPEGHPNHETCKKLIADLSESVDAQGRTLKVHTIEAPPPMKNEAGPIPATYCNYYLSNDALVVPVYGVQSDVAAIDKLKSLFPNRKVVPHSAKAVIQAGGAFHCLTQQLPLP